MHQMNASITSFCIYNIYLKFKKNVCSKKKKMLLLFFVVLEARLRFECYIYSNGMLPW